MLGDEFAGGLLALDDDVAVRRLERSADAAGSITELIAYAERYVRDDPGTAQRAATLAATAASRHDLPALGARADYVRAQACAAAGELASALGLIERSRIAFEAAQLPVEAARTNLGRINVLNEMGRHTEAIASGEEVLAAVVHLEPGHERTDLLELTAAAHQNLGVCYELSGRFTDALAAYSAAESQYRDLGDQEGVGEVVYDRGLVLMALGRVNEAFAAFTTAANIFDALELRALKGASLTSAGEACVLLGEFARGLALLQLARHELDAIDAPWRDRTNLLVTARAYLALNCFPEALDAYRDAEGWFADHGMAVDRARATWGAALALSGQGDGPAARRALAEAASAFAFSGQTQWLAAVLIERAALEAIAGDSAPATSTAREALRMAVDSGAAVETARAHLRVAQFTTDEDDAMAHLDAARAFAETSGIQPLSVAVWQATGARRLAAGRVNEARTLFERAVEHNESAREGIAHEALLGNFLHDKVDAYSGLVRCEVETEGGDRGRRILAASERARSRTLTEMASGLVQRATTAGDAADTQLRAELAAIYTELLADTTPEQQVALRERSVLLERRIARRRLDRLDGTAARDTPVAVTPGSIDTPTLSYYCFDDGIAALTLLPHAEPTVTWLPATPAAIAEQLERLAIHWDRCRLGRDFVERHSATLEAAAHSTLANLFDLLIAPLAHTLPASGALVVLPHGPLHAVPWAALNDGSTTLVDRYSISVAPSLAMFDHCRSRAGRRGSRAVVVGVADELAPQVREEAALVAESLGDCTLLRDGDALAETVVAELTNDDVGVVHLAGHGWWRSDNPMYSAVRVADRWLTAGELMACDLDGALVVLSACDTGQVRVLAGDELHGLARAVLGAGAATLVACAWPADDAATRTFMAAFYASIQTGENPATATRAAQLAVRKQFPHPYYWAGFEVVGAA